MIETRVNEIEGNFSPPFLKRSYSFLMLNAGKKQCARRDTKILFLLLLLFFISQEIFLLFIIFFPQPGFTLYSWNNSHSLTPVLFLEGGFEMKLKVKKCEREGGREVQESSMYGLMLLLKQCICKKMKIPAHSFIIAIFTLSKLSITMKPDYYCGFLVSFRFHLRSALFK